jgi:hypothetical protein
MNKQQSIVINGVLVGCDYWDVPVRVEVKAFLRFSRRIDSQLRRLVVRWAHAAPPSARGVPATRGPNEASVPPTS